MDKIGVQRCLTNIAVWDQCMIINDKRQIHIPSCKDTEKEKCSFEDCWETMESFVTSTSFVLESTKKLCIYAFMKTGKRLS